MTKTLEIYVSPFGCDCNPGTFDKPIATPKRAFDEVAGLDKTNTDITVYFMSGDYRFEHIELTVAHSNVVYKAYGDGKVIFNGGITLQNDKFKKVTDKSVKSRFKQRARSHIFVYDLDANGVSRAILGNMYCVGSASTAAHYNDGTQGTNCELFWNDVRLTPARYPNEGFCKVTEVISEGEKESKTPGAVRFNKNVARVMRTWQEPQKAWMFGYFKYDWADMTCPLEAIDSDEGIAYPKHYSTYGYRKDAQCYFLNVLEELDSASEYYIDRDNMLLYIYCEEETVKGEMILSVSPDVLMSGEISNAVFDGIEFKGVRNDVIIINGDNNTFKNCKIANSYGNALKIKGVNNTVSSCEICYMGKGGVYLKGGDRATLTHGNNVVENCYIHHFAQVFRTYQRGIFLVGCGNTATHNELSHTPHCVLSYDGNEHEISYNYIHDAVFESNDAGALYVGGDWTSYGTVIKYNLFKDIGGVIGKWPKAIYFDDGMSAAEIFGNIVVNCYGRPLNFGGGRDIKAWNNLTISDIDFPLFYDDRMAKGGWAEGAVFKSTDSGLWVCLDRVPYTNELWRNKYPRLASIVKDLEQWESPDFPGNPAYSVIENNIFIGKRSHKESWHISDNVYKYSTIENNHTFTTADEAIIPGTYHIKPEVIEEYNMTWEQIPYEEIGRYKE